MNNRMIRSGLSFVGLVILTTGSLRAHSEGSSGVENFAALVGSQYRIHANITYKVANGYEAKLDVYEPRDTDEPRATVIYIHGAVGPVAPKRPSPCGSCPISRWAWRS